LEQAARLARREFFRRCLDENLVDRVALGHNRTDQAETVLFRFLRGAGTAGLAGMRFVTDGWLIRPLLTLTRSEIRAWAEVEGIRWRQDSSNEDRRFARNRLRLDVIPALTADFNLNLEGVLAATALVAQAEEEYWNSAVEPIFQQVGNWTYFGWLTDIGYMATLNPAVQRRLLRRILLEIRGDLRGLDCQHVEAIMALFHSRHGHDRAIVPGADVLRSFDKLLFRSTAAANLRERQYCQELTPGLAVDLPFHAGRIYVDSETPDHVKCANFKKDLETGYEIADLDGDALTRANPDRPLYVRNWEPGDQIQRCGHQGAEKLKSLFQEYRVVLWERRHWPVVMVGNDVAWARKFGSDARFSANEECRRRVRLTYEPFQ
jgi:tRNA(Ile)-lysidine synthase